MKTGGMRVMSRKRVMSTGAGGKEGRKEQKAKSEMEEQKVNE